MYNGFSSARNGNLKIATRISEEVLCLPLFPDLEVGVIDLIANILD
jgi:dTDP-4-amino-4,6-dideoxygalactose transaminase